MRPIPPEAPPRAWRLVIAGVGAPVAALMLGSALIAFLPLSAPLALAIGAHSIVPLWIALACTLPLAPSARVAALIWSVLTLLPAAALAVRASADLP